MTPNPTWSDIALRLALTALTGALIGFNRGEHGKSAGLRTNLLVALAAAISMVQVNLLLDTHGRAWDSFVRFDPMRLPLGILSGVGFIGAGAILQTRRSVVGVTTAATLWFATVMGLCFGAGHLILGAIAFLLGIGVLWGLKLVESRWQRKQHARLALICTGPAPDAEEITRRLAAAGVTAVLNSVIYGEQAELHFNVSWQARPHDHQPPAVLQEIAALPTIRRAHWKS